MELKIDAKFAKSYNDFKIKEDNSKSKKILNRKIKELESSSSSSESEDEDESRQIHDEFAERVNVLLAELDTKGVKALEVNHDWSSKSDVLTMKPNKILHAKDLNSKLLLKSGKDDEDYLNKIDEIAKVDSKEISKVTDKIDFSKFCNFEGDLFAPSTNQRDIKNIDDGGIEDNIEKNADSSESCLSDNEDKVDNLDSLMTLNVGRHADTLRPKSSKRKEQRKLLKERKENEKKELKKKLRDIKLKEMEEKYEKIKRANPAILKYLKPEDLEDDFDLDKHNAIMERLFEENDEDYPVDEEKPVFSDDEFGCNIDYDDDNLFEEKVPSKVKQVESESVSVKPRKKNSNFANMEDDVEELAKPKEIYDPETHGNFRNFMKKHAPVICDDIIKGVDGDDIVCKFKYRSVEPQTFGLTMEEIILADNKELNKWASLKKVVTIKSHEQEIRDEKHYQSESRQRKKYDILSSVYGEEQPKEEEVEANDEEKETKISKASKKRLRKKLNKQILYEDLVGPSENITNAIAKEVSEKMKIKAKDISEKVSGESEIQSKKKRKHDSERLPDAEESKPISKEEGSEQVGAATHKPKKSKAKKQKIEMPHLSGSRLESYGISEGYYRFGLKGKKKREGL